MTLGIQGLGDGAQSQTCGEVHDGRPLGGPSRRAWCTSTPSFKLTRPVNVRLGDSTPGAWQRAQRVSPLS
jgi:hypothetical protein